jgi:phage terminase large subunit-like protein
MTTSVTRKLNRSNKRDYAGIAKRYARDVVAGNIPACKQVIQACARQLNDLKRSERGDGFAFVFDSAQSSARVCKFIEALPHIKGKWSRSRELITLEPWQLFILTTIFGWVERDDPTHYRFHEAYIEVPRKNGKSIVFGGGVGLYKFSADNESGAEVYFGATSKEHAEDVGFGPARMMAERTPALCEAFGIKVHLKSLRKPGDGAVMKPVIAKPGDGQNPSCVIVEEYHQHASDWFVEAMKTGMGARENPLLLYVTTAGTDRSSPCFALRLELEKLLAGLLENDRFFAVIYTIDEGDDWKSVDALIKANPNWHVSINQRKILSDQKAALHSPRKQASFKTKHLNVWVNAAAGWMNMEKWDALADPTLRISQFHGKECFIGADLADRIDCADTVRVFPAEIDGKPHFYVFASHYLNQHAIDDAGSDNFRRWAAEGKLIATPGNVTDYVRIGDDLVRDSREFIVREIPHDPHHATPLIQFIQAREDWDQGIECVAVTQKYEFFSQAMKEAEAAIFEGRIHHDGDPVLAWMISNVVCKRDRRDNVMPEKQRPENKIDGAVALLMAFYRCLLKGGSGYTRSKVIVV